MTKQKKGRAGLPEKSGQATTGQSNNLSQVNLPGEGKAVNFKDTPFAEYLCLSPTGEPTYETIKIIESAFDTMIKSGKLDRLIEEKLTRKGQSSNTGE
jgi:hypothetical protein